MEVNLVVDGQAMEVDSPGVVVYGELVVLGLNGHFPVNTGDVNLKSKFTVLKRKKGNSQKPHKQYCHETVVGSVHYQSNDIHAVCYSVSENKQLVVSYESDPDRDMFQIGRSSDMNDFVVMDIVPNAQKPSDCMLQKSTISRFACRICVDRTPPYTARIYAAGFDKSCNIHVGEKAMKWPTDDNMMDGLTTNGVWLLKPQTSEERGVLKHHTGIWREVSINGDIYGLRKARSDRGVGKRIANESNILTDGTLIDLCGAILLWRSREGMAKMPTLHDIEEMRRKLNDSKPLCPVGLMTLEFPSSRSSSHKGKSPHAYLVCGHVHGYHTWNSPLYGCEHHRTCPLCRQVGPYVRLILGNEPSLWVDCESSYYCFVPCGHTCSESTVRFWSQIPLPHGCHAFRAACPFCGTPLEGETGFVKLIFSTAW